MNRLHPPFAPPWLCAAVCCLAVIPGLRGADQPAPPPAAAVLAGPADLAPIGPPSPEILADVAAHARNADDLWAYIKKYSGTEDLEAIDPDLDQESKMAKARELVRDKVSHLRPAVDEMLKRYPQDPHRWDAKLMRVSFQREQNAISDEDALKILREIAAAPDASEGVKRQARSELLEETLSKATPATGLTDDIEKQITAFEKDFPDDPVGEQFVGLRIKMLELSPDKIVAELKTLTQSPNKATADAAGKELKLRTEPLDLKFTTLDGKEFDFAKLRGKVVLVDCWATWCAPCLMKMPDLQALEKKYAANKDFQLIGVSLDDDKADVEKIVKSKRLTWPQYYDGKVWQNEISSKLGVTGLPATFLVDRKGFAHPVDLEADLDAEVGKALAVEDGKR